MGANQMSDPFNTDFNEAVWWESSVMTVQIKSVVGLCIAELHHLGQLNLRD